MSSEIVDFTGKVKQINVLLHRIEYQTIANNNKSGEAEHLQ